MKFANAGRLTIGLAALFCGCAGAPQHHVVYDQGERTTYDSDGEWTRKVVSMEYHPLTEAAPPDISTPPTTLMRMSNMERYVGASPRADLIDMSPAQIPFVQDVGLPGGENKFFRISGDKGLVYGVASYSGSGPNRELMGCSLLSKGNGAIYEAYWQTKPGDWTAIKLPAPIPLGEYRDASGRKGTSAGTNRHDFLKAIPAVRERIGEVQGIEDTFEMEKLRGIPVVVGTKSEPAASMQFQGQTNKISEITGDRGSVYIYQEIDVDKGQAFLEKCVIYPEPVAKVIRAWYQENVPAKAKAPGGPKEAGG
ncbi:hypothetical protein BH09SUM1_BH09SUM1_29820 [soil metagenome]